MIGLGTKKAKVISTVLAQAGTGTWQVVATFEDETGERGDSYMPITDKNGEPVKWTLDRLRKIGFDLEENDLDIMPLNEGENSPCVGHEATIRVFEDTYNGKTTTKVEILTGGSATAAAPDTARAFTNSLRTKFVAMGLRPKGRPAPGAKDDKEDVPF